MSNMYFIEMRPTVYYYEMDLATKQVSSFKRELLLKSNWGVTAYYRDSDLEIGAMSTFLNDNNSTIQIQITFFLQLPTQSLTLYNLYHHYYDSIDKVSFMATELAVNRIN